MQMEMEGETGLVQCGDEDDCASGLADNSGSLTDVEQYVLPKSSW